MPQSFLPVPNDAQNALHPKESEIMGVAIEFLKKEIGLAAHWESRAPQSFFDGELHITLNERVLIYNVEIKPEFRSTHLPLILRYREMGLPILLVAEYIPRNLKENLRKLGVAYLEANGDIYLPNEHLFIWIERPQLPTIKKEKGNRAFTPTGLMVVFQLLMDKALINEPQRTMATKANVALGNIPQVIEGLKNTGYLISLDHKQFVWEKRKNLLDRWINGYETIIKPKISKGRFRLRSNWQDIELSAHKTVWGGEPAADLLTHYLRPDKLILFTQETRAELIKNYQMIPDENGQIEVFEAFWEINGTEKTAPAILVYADLIIKGGKRNYETAKIIYDEFIQPNL